MTPEEFYDFLAKEGFELSSFQKKQFQDYFELLVEWNEKIFTRAVASTLHMFRPKYMIKNEL